MSAPYSEELRLALVMNGGVSLAVWMGGVTNEIHRLVTRKHTLYAELLDLTHTTARVDVISGASAGGINGAALALALMYDGDFSCMRKVWLQTGSLSALLRPPLGDNPASLLRGDDYFLPQLELAFAELARNAGKASHLPASLPMDLRMSTTLMQGETGTRVDDLGEPLRDQDFRACFRFTHLEGKPSDFAQPQEAVKALAKAARSTASFPFAFEPSCIEPDKLDAHLSDAFDRPLKGKRYVIDGGVLDNKPFRGALSSVFSMPCRGGVRRVLAYINPDPGDGASAPLAERKEGPALSEVLSASILSIPQSQAIADQLHEIDAHNHQVRMRRSNILNLVSELTSMHDINALAQSLFPLYRQRRLANTFELFVYNNLMQAQARSGAGAALKLGKRSRDQLKRAFQEQPWDQWLPMKWPGSAEHAYNQVATWEWGLFPVEFAAQLLLDLLRMRQGLADYSTHESLDTRWATAFELIGLISQLRAREQREHWDPSLDGLFKEGVLSVERISAHYKSMMAFLGKDERRQTCGALALRLAQAIQSLCIEVLASCREVSAQPLRARERSQAELLTTLATYFAQGTVHDLLYRLLQIEVIEYAFHDHDNLNQDALVELVQISGDAASPLGGKEYAREKLLGLQLAHFAAFYKQSWRANDWLYGRLDGCARLIKILLNPDRLHRFYFGQADLVFEKIKHIAFGACADANWKAEVERRWAPFAGDMQRELSFLNQADSHLPDALPSCAAALTMALQLDILREEMPELIHAIRCDKANGAGLGSASRVLLDLDRQAPTLSAARTAEQFGKGLLGEETLLDQAGTDLFTRTLTHALATLQATLSSKAAHLGPLSALFASLKLPILGFYFVARGLTHQSRTSAALHGGLLAAGAVMVATQFLWPSSELGDVSKFPGLWVSLGWALLAYGVLMTVVRAPRTLGSLLFLGLALLAWWINSTLLSVYVAVLTLLIFSVQFPVLQWIFGLGAVAFAGLWGADMLPATNPALSVDRYPPVLGFSLVVVGSLLVAMWQASPFSARLEEAARRGLRKLSGLFRR